MKFRVTYENSYKEEKTVVIECDSTMECDNICKLFGKVIKVERIDTEPKFEPKLVGLYDGYDDSDEYYSI